MAMTETMEWALSVVTFFSTITVLLRLFCKHTRGTPIRRDDYTVIAAWTFLVTAFILLLIAASHGYGQHLAVLGENPIAAVQLVAASIFFAVGSSALGKTAIACTLLQVLRVPWQRKAVWTLAVSVNLISWGFAIFLWVIIWEERLVEICRDAGAVWGFAIVGAVWSAATDFAFAGIAWPFVLPLQRSLEDKIGLGVAMSFGVVSGILAIVKTTEMRCSNFERDITYDSVPLVILTIVEPATIIIAATAPILNQFFRNPKSQTTSQRELLGGGGSSHSTLRPSLSFPSSSRSDQRATWSITGGPFDRDMPLQQFITTHDSILRTDEVVIDFQDTRSPSPAETTCSSRILRPRTAKEAEL